MEYRRLGRTDLQVSAICLGTMTWGSQNTESEAHAQMDHAFDQGINFVDTAEIYPSPPRDEAHGRTEAMIGSWLQARGRRDEIVLASKVMGRAAPGFMLQKGEPRQLDACTINRAVEASLKRLRTDYLDLYQVHWPDRPSGPFGADGLIYKHRTAAEEVPIAETLEALGALVKAGKVRHIGISNETPWGTMEYLRAAGERGLPRIQSIQNAYHLLNRVFELGGAEIAHREGVGLLAYSPIAQGVLSGKYLDGALPPGARKTLYNRLQRYETPMSEPATRGYLALAREYGLDPAQMAIRFCLARSFVTSAIIGATSLDQLKIAIGAAHIAWPEELETAVNALHHANPNPCP